MAWVSKVLAPLALFAGIAGTTAIVVAEDDSAQPPFGKGKFGKGQPPFGKGLPGKGDDKKAEEKKGEKGEKKVEEKKAEGKK